MKIKDLKHNHSLTDLLKILIFSILMLLPFLAVVTKSLYVICNKNAYQSYSQISTDTIDNYDEYLDNQGKIINFIPTNASETLNYQLSFEIIVTDVEVIKNTSSFDLTNLTKITCYIIPDRLDTYFAYYNGSTSLGQSYSQANLIELNFKLNNVNNPTNFNTFLSLTKPFTYKVNNQLDNVFYYAIDEMSDNQLFSWTKNTGIYTGVKAMTDNLEITTDVIAVLITYWTLLTVIYVIIDIVLKGFTLLTHMFQKESH